VNGKQVVLIGSCKWRNEYLKPGDLDELERAGTRVGATKATRYVLFSRSGFDPALIARAKAERVWLVTPRDMFAPDLIDQPTA
jgi:hypothetical protein